MIGKKLESPACNARGELSTLQVKNLKRQTASQIFLFTFVFVVLFPISLFGINIFVEAFGVGDLPIWAFIFMIAVFGGLAVLSLGIGYLALASIPYYFKVPKLRVEYFESEPIKKSSFWQYSTTLRSTGMSMRFGSPMTIGAGIVHDRKFYAAPLSIFSKIPNSGLCRFYYVLRPSVPMLLGSFQIVGFEILKE